VFTKTGFVWQKLTSQERLLAVDFLATASSFLTEAGCAALVDMIRIPVKAIIQVGEQLDSFMQNCLISTAGQGTKWSAPNAVLGLTSSSPAQTASDPRPL